MKISEDGNVVTTTSYKVEIIPERLLVVLSKSDRFYYGMSMLSAVDTICGTDKCSIVPKITEPRKEYDHIALDIECDSSIWDKKIHHYEFYEDRVEYWTEVFGVGNIDRVYYFRGTIEGNELASVPGFTRVFSPLPNFLEKQEFHASEPVSISAGNTKEELARIRGNAFHGAPTCFVFHDDEGYSPCLSAGVLAHPGELQFHSFEINHMNELVKNAVEPIIGTQAFSLAYFGHQKVHGYWKTPKIRLAFEHERWRAVKDYVDALRRYGGFSDHKGNYPAWTREPVYCTWHDQVAIGMSELKKTNLSFVQCESSAVFFDALNQKKCEKWLKLLNEHHAKPGVFIIDATWQTDFGNNEVDTTKFPDLRRFIDSCHEQDVRVLLWVRAWTNTNISDDECALFEGRPAYVDPTNPKYRDRVANMVKRMLSSDPGCYNADGLKYDGIVGCGPCGEGLKTYSGLAGFELHRSLLKLYHDESKKVKEDSAFELYTSSPYFADTCDIVRTGDLYTVRGDACAAEEFRVRSIRSTMPNVPIDTDGAERFNVILPFGESLAVQRKVGVPCVYQAEQLIQRRDFCVPTIKTLNKSDYSKISEAFK